MPPREQLQTNVGLRDGLCQNSPQQEAKPCGILTFCSFYAAAKEVSRIRVRAV
jgi:hypothetical protein